ncbi:MAG TPA: protein-L-isoaspartate(D-aspartate) O-methyltransferase [Sphingomonadales bacterium]
MAFHGSEFAALRRHMVEHQLRRRGIHDEAVLAAMGAVPRELFVPPELASEAYDDGPLPIGGGQTISQPWVVAAMIQMIEPQPTDRVLEVGAGSGYAAAVLSRIVAEVVTIERLASLAEAARERITRFGYDNVTVVEGDGSLGHAPRAPYNAILVAAGAPAVPDELCRQLAIGGRLVIPVGQSRLLQELVRVRRIDDSSFETERLEGVRFVPLIGAQGWNDPAD